MMTHFDFFLKQKSHISISKAFFPIFMAQNSTMKARQVFILLMFIARVAMAQDTTHFINRYKTADGDRWTLNRKAYYLNSFAIDSADLNGFYGRGYSNLQLGLYDSAIIDFKRSIDAAKFDDFAGSGLSQEEDYQPIFLIGLCFTFLEQPDSASYYFQRAIDDNPKFEDPYFELAKISAINGEPTKGLDYCDRALLMNPSSSTAYYFKAIIYYYSGNERAALKELKKLKKLDPKNTTAPLVMAEIYFNKKNYDAVIKYASASIKLDDGNPQAYLYRGAAQLQKNRFHEALSDLETGLSKDTSQVQFNYYLGLTHFALKQYNQAVGYFAKNIENEKKNLPKYYAAKWQELELKEILLALHTNELTEDEVYAGQAFLKIILQTAMMTDVNAIRKYARNYPESVFIGRVNNLLSYFQYGRKQNIISTYDLIALDSTLYFVMMHNADLLEKQNRDTASINRYSQVIGHIPEYTYAYSARGLVYQKTHQYHLALRDLQKSMEMNPDFLLAQYHLAGVYYDMELYPQSIHNYREVQKKINEIPLLDFGIGKCYFKMGFADSASYYYEKALAIWPKYPDALHGAGKIAFDRGNYKEAISLYNQSIGYGGRSAQFLMDRAEAKIALKKYGQAVYDYVEAMKMDPKSSEAYYGAGWASYLAGKYHQCIDYSTKAVQYDQSNFEAMYNIALSHLRLGHFEEARKYYLAVVKANLTDSESIEPKAIADLQDMISTNKMRGAAQEMLDIILDMEAELKAPDKAQNLPQN